MGRALVGWVVAVMLGLGQWMPAAAQQRASITIARAIDADRYDPHRTAARAAGEVLHMLADTLVTLDWDQRSIRPGLAREWEVSEDGLRYTFRLRDDVRFCSGREMTAVDVAWSLSRWVDPATRSPTAWRAGRVVRIHATDSTTLVYELAEPHADLLHQLSLFFGVVLDREAVERLGEGFGIRGFGGTGPFCWREWVPGSRLTLVRHAAYRWGPPIYANRGPAEIDRVVWTVQADDAARGAAVMGGQADLTPYPPLAMMEALRRHRLVQIVEPSQPQWLAFLGFKVDRPQVADVRVRRAIAHAVDRAALVRQVYFGEAHPAISLLAPGTLDYSASASNSGAGYDPAAAVALLEEAGWPLGADGFRQRNGQRLSLDVYGFAGPWQRVLEAVQADLAQIGVEMRVSLFDPAIAWGRLAGQDFDAFVLSAPYVSAGDLLGLYFDSRRIPTPNRMNWRDAETDQLLARGRTALTADERATAHAALQARLQEATVWLPLVHERLPVAAHTRITGLRAHGLYGIALHQALDLRLR
ncbi:MAG: ABC transporter substrate-binding protein [Alphaproteobacteria bacterium]|nr:ABC transporter substrate-binding protein [Alphaproteobacteria bacterium]